MVNLRCSIVGDLLDWDLQSLVITTEAVLPMSWFTHPIGLLCWLSSPCDWSVSRGYDSWVICGIVLQVIYLFETCSPWLSPCTEGFDIMDWETVLPTLWFTCQIGLLWNCLLRVIKLLGGWPKLGLLFICLPRALLFFFKFASFLSIQRAFEPFQCSRTFFSSISGIETSWRAISIDYQLQVEVNSLIVFPPNWVILIILWLKSTQIWESGRIITW